MPQRIGQLDAELVHPAAHVFDLAAQFVNGPAVLVDDRDEVLAALAALQDGVRRVHPPQGDAEGHRHAEGEYADRRSKDRESSDSVRIELHR